MNKSQVLVLGGGPAGGAVAIGLVRLGYSVTLVSEPRPFDAVEGISDRVVQGLQGAGFNLALEQMAEPSPRRVTWNGITSAANTERLIPRQAFDLALLDDLKAQGTHVIQGRVTGIQPDATGHVAEVSLVSGEQLQLQGDFLVEARGRAAPAAGVPRVKGSQTVSLLQYWQGPADTPCSAVQSFADGWAWMALRADGRRYLQLTLDVASADLPPKRELGDWCQARLSKLEQAQPFMAGAEPAGEVYARTSTPVLCEHSVGNNWIRVGDAAMAVDPLSGNGIFQALSSALQAPAVINTLINHPERAGLAKQFHEARIEGLFYRFARIGRDFYAQESQWPTNPFWQGRSQWPDQVPLHLDVMPDQVSTGVRPVVQDGLIREAQVVITPDQPLGIWHLNGLELAPLLEQVRARPDLTPAEQLSHTQGPVMGERLALWMQQQGWVDDPKGQGEHEV
ncbi:flavin-dependent monooxygenase QhpG [Marinobacterium iners]|uniref:Dehydrogenase (Flavoprotein) n=1 Tax=Marinobacterium iners DSM 11526 TaxID=1122198 RepID=A0A1H4EIE9_9GAMM|nr:FAD-dependent monooxygenase [Marinobacterium iners]SEA84716.1 Dehydrogenase (flavoprotein) [Marinobacterium iners DSM 11526]